MRKESRSWAKTRAKFVFFPRLGPFPDPPCLVTLSHQSFQQAMLISGSHPGTPPNPCQSAYAIDLSTLHIVLCVLLYQVSEGCPTDGSQTALLCKQNTHQHIPSEGLGWAGHSRVPEGGRPTRVEILFQRDANAWQHLGTELLGGNSFFPTFSFILLKEKLSFAHRCCSQLRSSLGLWFQYLLLMGCQGPRQFNSKHVVRIHSLLNYVLTALSCGAQRGGCKDKQAGICHIWGLTS